MRLKTKIIGFFCATLIIMSAVSATAAFNAMLNYQGRLTDSDGVPLSDGAKDMQFRICSDSGCAGVEWTETWNAGTSQVTVTDGLFSVNLGTHTAITGIDWTQDLWLEVTVSGTLYTPRQKLTGVAYSMYATSIADNTVNSAKVTNNTLTADDLSVNVVSSVDGVTNDGGNIDLIAGSGIAITPNDGANTITITASAGGIDHGTLSGLGDDDHTQYVLDAGDTMSGTLNMNGNIINNVADPTAGTHAMDRDYADARYVNDGCTNCLNATEIEDIYLLTAGDTMGGTLNMGNNAITNINWAGSDDGSGSGLDADLLDGMDSSAFMTAATDNWVDEAGDTMSGTLDMNGNIINNVADPTAGTHAMDRDYADARYVNDGCTNCLNATEIEDIYLLTAGDTMGGTLNMGNNAITNINWGASDDGSGSGLDADLLDGMDSTDFMTAVTDDWVDEAGDTMTGNLTMGDNNILDANTVEANILQDPEDGTIQINDDVLVYSADTGEAIISAYGSAQGTGRLYLGQSTTHGGGMIYNGDDTPDVVGNTDDISIYRRDSGTDVEVLHWAYDSSTAIFEGNINAGGNTIYNLADPTAGTHAMDRDYADSRYVNDGCTDCLNATEIEDIYVFNSGDTMTGNLNMNGNDITEIDDVYVNDLYDRGGGSMIEVWDEFDMNGNRIEGVGDPNSGDDAMDRDYADNRYRCYYTAEADLTGSSAGSPVETSCNANFCAVAAVYSNGANDYYTMAAQDYDSSSLYFNAAGERYLALRVMCCPCQ